MKKKVIVKGPFLSRSGYGEQARFALRSLRTKENIFDIFLLNIRWGETGWVWEDNEERDWIDEQIRKTVHYIEEHRKNNIPPQFDISLQVTIPQEWEKMASINIGYTAGTESTKMSPQWVEKALMMDKILVTSHHTKYAFEHSSYQAQHPQTGEVFKLQNNTPLEVVSYPVRQFEPCENFELSLKHDFNFLCNAQWSPRKNIENTIKWWLEEFWDQDVGLVVKGNIKNNSYMDKGFTEERLKSLLKEFEDRKCSVYLLHGDLSENELSALYQHDKIKCFINLAHGEGFGLPVFEAAYYGLPVVAPNWGGLVDFLYKPKKNKKGKEKNRPYFTKVDCDIKPVQKEAVWEPIIIKDSMWAFPKQGSYKMGLRKVYKQYDQVKKRAESLQEWLVKDFREDKKYRGFVNSFYEDETANIEDEQVPTISLVTSVYKAEKFIDQLMEDVTQQSVFEDKCEWIIFNANEKGEDYEEEVIQKYIKKYPNNIVYKRLKKDPGAYGVWNAAIKKAKGEFITNVNCDDRRVPWAFEKQAKLLVANPDVDLIYNDSYAAHEPNINWESVNSSNTQRYMFEKFSKEALLRSNLPHNNPMWRKALHDKFGYFDTKYKSSADWDFWLKCAFGGSKFKKADEILGVYYFNPEGISTDKKNASWKKEDEREIFQRYLKIIQEESKM